MLESAARLNAQTVTVDPATLTLGYMNWLPMAGDASGYGGTGGGSWGLADLQASFSGTTLTLSPNINTYVPGNPYWVNANGSGANRMDANIYNEATGTYVGTTLTFNYNVVANTLASGYSAQAFIKDFAPDYSSVTQTTAALTPGAGSVSLLTSANAGDHIQYGFEMFGPNANPATVAALGTVVIAPATVVIAAGPTNLLSNAGFEADPPGENQSVPGWTSYGPNVYSETGATIAHDGVNYLKIYQDLGNGSVNFGGVYQDYISGPGATCSADGRAYMLSTDKLAGQNAVWIEVTFRDANANVLALYRSAIVTTNSVAKGIFPVNTWMDLPVTNQYNPITYVITNTVTHLTAPAGTCFVRYQLLLQGDGKGSGGSIYFDDCSLHSGNGSAYGNWNIVWSDEFNGTTINPNIWTYDIGNGGSNPGWGNNELEYYTSRTNNVYEAGGRLHIVAQQESYGGMNYTSARLKSQGLFSCKTGRIEWRAKLPQGVGCWPALWLLGTNISSIGWPGCGEIDVMENNGSSPGTVQGSLHSGSDETGYYNFISGAANTAFHTYTLDWTTNAILFYVDGHLYESQTGWSSSIGNYPFPFDQPFFFIMNLAIGGSFVGNPSSSSINGGTTFPAEMQVDYVRIYNQTAPLKLSANQTGATIMLNWPTNIVCHLQMLAPAASGLQTTNWTDLPTTSGPAYVAPTNGRAFYRLQSP